VVLYILIMGLPKHLITLLLIGALAIASFTLYLFDYEIYGGAYLIAEPVPKPVNGDVLKLRKEDLDAYPDLKTAIETGEPQLPSSNILEVLGSRRIVEVDGKYYRVYVMYWDAIRRRPRFMYAGFIFSILFSIYLLYLFYRFVYHRSKWINA